MCIEFSCTGVDCLNFVCVYVVTLADNLKGEKSVFSGITGMTV
jgi:hypothetical protein